MLNTDTPNTNYDLDYLHSLHPESKLTTKQASGYLGCPVPTLNWWRHRGQGGPQYMRLGKKCIRYRKADLDVFLESAIVIPGEQCPE